MRVTVRRDRCIASGQCVSAVGEVFDQNEDDGSVVLLTEAPPAGLAAEVRRAASVCPALAIIVEE